MLIIFFLNSAYVSVKHVKGNSLKFFTSEIIIIFMSAYGPHGVVTKFSCLFEQVHVIICYIAACHLRLA